MNVPRLLAYVLSLAPAFLPACASTSPASDESPYTTGDDCICGSPYADLYGCYCDLCLFQGGNPQNPDCTCLPLNVRDGMVRTSVSFGGTSGSVSTIGTVGGLVGLETLVLRRGGRIEGAVIADTGEEIQFERADGQVATYSYDDLNTRSVYKLLLAKTSRTDGPAEFRLATYAGDIGLYAQAQRHFGFAVEADPSLAEDVDAALAELRQTASEQELAAARAAWSEGDAKTARKHIANVLADFPDEPAAKEAAGVLDELEATARAREDARIAEELSASVQEAIQPLQKRYLKMGEYNDKGLTSGSNLSTAVRWFNRAISEGDGLHRDIDKIQKKKGQEPAILEVASDYETRTDGLLVDVHCNLASLYIVRTDYQGALASVNAALAIDPQSQEARATRARVEAASSDDDWGYGYRVLRPRIARRR